MKTMNRIYVSPYKLDNGQWSRRRILFAAFRSVHDMDLYTDELREQHPTWIIETYETGRSRVVKETK